MPLDRSEDYERTLNEQSIYKTIVNQDESGYFPHMYKTYSYKSSAWVSSFMACKGRWISSLLSWFLHISKARPCININRFRLQQFLRSFIIQSRHRWFFSKQEYVIMTLMSLTSWFLPRTSVLSSLISEDRTLYEEKLARAASLSSKGWWNLIVETLKNSKNTSKI